MSAAYHALGVMSAQLDEKFSDPATTAVWIFTESGVFYGTARRSGTSWTVYFPQRDVPEESSVS